MNDKPIDLNTKLFKCDETADAQSLPSEQFSSNIKISELGEYGTSSTTADISPYLHTLPNDIDIFREVTLSDAAIPDAYVRRMTSHFIFSFQRIVMNNRTRIGSSGHLQPLKFRSLEDGSVLLEWIFLDFRIGFSIEKEEGESSWYLVSNQKLDEVSLSGVLNISDIDSLLSRLIEFVMLNT